MNESMLKLEHVYKEYRLGMIGGTTLREELQRWGARMLHREDPTRKIGSREYAPGETFMALSDVSFEVMKGERLGIIGHNGAGKSTLLKLISRITAPKSGDIWLNGRVASMLEVGTGFHGELTGRENIYMNGAILGMKRREIDAKIEDIIEFSECRQFIDTPVKRYSSGMYVKLAFSVAAHLDSEIMIMDEVLAVGDMAFQKKCLEKMSDVSRTESRTILYVSHNMNTIRQLCERVIVLDHGRVIFDGDVEEGIERYMGEYGKTQNSVEVSSMMRDPEFRPHPVTMSRIEYMNDDGGIYDLGSFMRLRLDCETEKDVSEAFVRIIIKGADGTPVTMMTSDHSVPLRTTTNNRLDMDLDVSMLAPGHYTISPVIYEVNRFGNSISLDGLKEPIGFEIRQPAGFNHNMSWQTRYWGHIYGKPLHIQKG